MAPIFGPQSAPGAILVLMATAMAAVPAVSGFFHHCPSIGSRAAPPTTSHGVRHSMLRRSIGPADGAADGTASAASSSVTAQEQQQQQNGHTRRQWDDPDVAAYASGYATVFEEIPFRLCRPSFGTIPADLRGSYYKAGPAMYSAGSIVPPKTSIVQPKRPPVKDGADPQRIVLHPMEGDGGLLGVTFTRPTQQIEEGAEEDGSGNAAAEKESDDDVACVVRFRYVRTPGFTNERKKGQRMYTGMDATRQLRDANDDAFQGLANDHPLPLFRHHYQPGLNKLRKHTANTRAVFWGKRLFCLWEGGQPYKVDGRALGTEGRSQLGGAVLKDTDPIGGVLRVDAAAQRAILYGISHGAQSSDLTLYEFNSDFRLVPNGGRRTFLVPGFLLVNDMGVTSRYAVFVAPNVQCSAVQFLVNKDPGKVLKVEKGGTVVLVPRAGQGAGDDDAKVRTIPIAPDALSEANLQIVNAYEADNNLVVLDVIRSDGSQKRPSQASSKWPWATTPEAYRNIASRKSLWRYTVDVQDNSVSKQPLLDRHVDFATINPQFSSRPHQYVYMNVGGARQDNGDSTRRQASPPQGVLRYDVATGDVQEWMPDEPHEFCGEPLFVPRDKVPKSSGGTSAPEDDGYLLSVLYNGKARESEVVIFDAARVSSGPITRIPIGAAIPHGYHGCFASEHANWSPDEILRRAKLHDKMESRGNYWNEVKSDFSGLGLRLDDMEEYFGDFFS